MSAASILPAGPFGCIYADPPWSFAAWSHRGEDRGAVQHYACMDLAAIRALPVREVAADDAALFLWVVQPLLPEAFEVIADWGFRYKTIAFVWVKTNGGAPMLFYDQAAAFTGLGYHTRSGAELCLLATRGKGYRRRDQGVRQVVLSPRREHSRKPDEIAAGIERLVGDVPKLEMFARTRRPGWSAWGNQTDKFTPAPAVGPTEAERMA